MSEATRRVGRSTSTRKAQHEAQSQRKTTTSRKRGKTQTEEETQTEVLGDSRFGPGVEPAFVRVSAGGTYNMGDYESMRIDVSVTLPCLPEDINATYKEASQFVAEKLQEEEILWMGKK